MPRATRAAARLTASTRDGRMTPSSNACAPVVGGLVEFEMCGQHGAGSKVMSAASGAVGGASSGSQLSTEA